MAIPREERRERRRKDAWEPERRPFLNLKNLVIGEGTSGPAGSLRARVIRPRRKIRRKLLPSRTTSTVIVLLVLDGRNDANKRPAPEEHQY